MTRPRSDRSVSGRPRPSEPVDATYLTWEWFDRFLFACFLFLLFAAPLPLASNRPWALGMLAIALWTVLLGAVGLRAWRGRGGLERLRSAAAPLVLLAGFCLLVAAQCVTLPLDALKLFDDAAVSSGPVSIDPTSTRLYLLTALTYLAGFAATVLIVNTRFRLLALGLALTLSGVFQAILGVTLIAQGESYEYLGLVFVPDRATGTFANADHLGNYLALCLSIGLGVLISQLQPHAAARNASERWLGALKFLMSTKMLLRLLLIVMVIVRHYRADIDHRKQRENKCLNQCDENAKPGK